MKKGITVGQVQTLIFIAWIVLPVKEIGWLWLASLFFEDK